jgi:anthranilate phosphoribosyltransferase
VQILDKLLNFQDLSSIEAEYVMSEIMNGNFSNIKLAAWLTALRMKGETYQEIAACASVMIKHAESIHAIDKNVIDIVGTGGDCKQTINISTAAAITAAASGLTVAKHGNRAVSSKSGSADVLTALGVNISISPKHIELCLNEVGIAFLFAPTLHPAMKYAMPVRKELGIRTIFNILGPISNPAKIKRAVIGVYEPRLCSLAAKAVKELGYKRAIVVYGNDGLDEITTTTTSRICEIKNKEIIEYEFDPQKYGIPHTTLKQIQGEGAKYNANIIANIFSGKEKGPAKNIIVLNSAAALIVGGKTDSWTNALALAEKTINNGDAQRKLQQIVEYTNT